MLFKKEHKDMILSGKKTVTRRNWKKLMVKVGGIYKAKLKLLSKDYFAKIKITKLDIQHLGDITLDDVKKEGYDSYEDFKRIWKKINGKWLPLQVVDVIEFEVVEKVGEKQLLAENRKSQELYVAGRMRRWKWKKNY